MNIVISRQDGNDGIDLHWAKGREAALYSADIYSIINDRTQLMVIGGAEIYSVFEDLVNKIYLTEVFQDFKDGDAFFSKQFDRRQWKTLDERDYRPSEEDEYPFRISVLERRLKSVRQRDLSDFMVEDHGISTWLRSQAAAKAEAFARLPDEQFELPIPSAVLSDFVS